MSSSRMRSSILCDEAIAPHLERAFTKGKPKAVALAVNSPGGSPVQASLISSRIRRLSSEKGVPVYAFVEDLAASGGYWIACAADEIHADPNSIVGSIGVISSSFGFHDLLKRSGIERRVHTSGDEKNAWDPFLPEKAEDVARLKEIQGQLHDNFIRHVEERRGRQAERRGPVHRQVLDRIQCRRTRLGGRHRALGAEDEGVVRRQGEVPGLRQAPPVHDSVRVPAG